uniref:NADH-ubiquinone oxidoreductase chain 3 n=1 Tax=Mesabolivar sp. ITV1036I2 TaxID=2508675 RepID=A0A411FEQ2_9ARAC|nr:NADH dehydrogenase subunit 3 [Mesabolivar sp. ITV1036I2]
MDVFIVMILVGIVFIILVMVSGFLQEDEFLTVYECGFDCALESRLSFSFRFFMLAMLFIVFDAEISLMMPLPYLFLFESMIILFVLFMVVLLVGTLYEIFLGSMEWV